MDLRNRINDEYFDWMYNLVCGKRYSRSISYRKLLTHLHNAEFIYLVARDENRASDGVALRRRFTTMNNCEDMRIYLDGPCSVLEMIIALAIRCEETIMDDPRIGDRTGQWFWDMIVSLGLGAMTDDRFNEKYVDEVLDTFLFRDYEPNGKGGLFTLKNCDQDLRKVEIWWQAMWYLNGFM